MYFSCNRIYELNPFFWAGALASLWLLAGTEYSLPFFLYIPVHSSSATSTKKSSTTTTTKFILPTPLLTPLCFLLLPRLQNPQIKLQDFISLGYLQKASLFSFNSLFHFQGSWFFPPPPDRLSPDRSSCDQAKSSSAFSLLNLR